MIQGAPESAAGGGGRGSQAIDYGGTAAISFYAWYRVHSDTRSPNQLFRRLSSITCLFYYTGICFFVVSPYEYSLLFRLRMQSV